MTDTDFPGRSTDQSLRPALRRGRRVALLAVAASSLTVAALATGGVAMAADPIGSAASEHHAHSAAGAALLSSYSIVTGTPTSVPANGRTNPGVLCPSGTRVLGGGEHNDSVAHVLLTDSYPVANGSGWQTVVVNNGPTAQTATAYAVCGN